MEDDNLIIAVNHRPSFEEFLTELGIKNKGLGAQFFEVVYADFFINALDLKLEYRKYYSVEYPTFKKYMEACHDIELEEAEMDRNYVFKINRLPSMLDEGYENNQLDVVLAVVRKWE